MKNTSRAALALIAFSISASTGAAQVFNYTTTDLQLMLRRPGGVDLEVNLGPIADFKAMPVGVETFINSTTRPGHSYDATTELIPTFGNVDNLSFAVVGANKARADLGTVNTSWITQARTDINTQSPVPPRFTSSRSAQVQAQISTFAGDGPLFGSVPYSSAHAANSIAPGLNTSYAVEIPGADNNSYSIKFQAPGGLKSLIQDTVAHENTTAVNFSSLPAGSLIRSDFYEFLPGSSSGTQGPATSLGYFSLYNNGTLSFTPVPEPSTVALLSSGLLTIWAVGRKAFQKRGKA